MTDPSSVVRVLGLVGDSEPAVESPDAVVLFVKSSKDGNLGDCPFSQRINWALREKRVPFTLAWVPSDAKPAWFKEKTAGTFPALRRGERFLSDSSILAFYVDEAFPEPKLRATDAWDRAQELLWLSKADQVFPRFVPLLRETNNPDADLPALRKSFTDLLGEFEVQLEKSAAAHPDGVESVLGGPFGLVELSLVPKLFHCVTNLNFYQRFDALSSYPRLQRLYESSLARPSYLPTSYPEKDVLAEWGKKWDLRPLEAT